MREWYDAKVCLEDDNLDSLITSIEPDGSFTFCIDNYSCVDEMYNDLKSFLKVALKNGNMCQVYDDANDETVLVCRYSHDNRIDDYGSPNLMWVSPEEEEMIYNYRDTQLIEAMNTDIIKNN